MWLIAALLLSSFVLLLFARIAETRRMERIFLYSGMAVWIAAMFLERKNDTAFDAIVGFGFLSVAVSDLSACPILRRRIVPPCVRV